MSYTPIDVLIIGAGMHVYGRGTSGYGTVLPAVVQAHRDGLAGRVLVATTSAHSVQAVHERRRHRWPTWQSLNGAAARS